MLNEHYIMSGSSFTFDLSEPPAGATALYLDVSACVPSGAQGGATVAFKTAAAAFGVDIVTSVGCSSQTQTEASSSKQVWMPSAAPHQISAAVSMSIGTAPPAQAQVRVLGWIGS